MSAFSEGKFYFIAEAGVNHEGDISRAKEMCLAAKEAGADAIKFQTYKAETLASKIALAYWDTNEESSTNQYELFKKFDGLNQADYEEIARYCSEIGIDFASTPFDIQAVEFLDPLVSYFKIASADITNALLISKIAEKDKPIILSTGASTISEIQEAVSLIRHYTDKEICLMHCILNYPTNNNHANIRMISDIHNHFSDMQIGYSDHTRPEFNFGVLTAAYTLGARVIEKHFTLDKAIAGNDHYHSFDERDLLNFRQHIDRTEELLGADKKNFLKSEVGARLHARRSLFYNKDLRAGDILAQEQVIALRPGSGISPMRIKEYIGRKLKTDIHQGELLEDQHFE